MSRTGGPHLSHTILTGYIAEVPHTGTKFLHSNLVQCVNVGSLALTAEFLTQHQIISTLRLLGFMVRGEKHDILSIQKATASARHTQILNRYQRSAKHRYTGERTLDFTVTDLTRSSIEHDLTNHT